jgi:excisionase family DNA binding protein
MRSHEVAALFNVTERTVINWVALGKLPARRTIGGHLRFRGEDVRGLLDRRPGAADADPVSPSPSKPGRGENGKQLLRSHEVARLSNVTERTVINWASSGKLPAFRTLGGHLRFRGEDVANLLDGRTRTAYSA